MNVRVIAWMILMSLYGFAEPNFGAPERINDGVLIQGGTTQAFKVTVTSDTTETLTSLTLSCKSGDINGDGTEDSSDDCNLLFDEDGGHIQNMRLLVSGGEVLTDNNIDTSALDVVTFTGDSPLELDSGSEHTLIFEFELSDNAPINATYELKVTAYIARGQSHDEAGAGTFDTDITGLTFQVVGVQSSFTQTNISSKIIYDQDLTNKVVSAFTVTPSAHEDYLLNGITIQNDAGNFDVDGTGEGVIDVELWKSTDANFEKDVDTLLAQLSDNTVSFNSTTEAVVNLDKIQPSLRTLTKNQGANFFLTYDIGPQTTILQDPSDMDSSPTEIKAKVTAIAGQGHDSMYDYGPIKLGDAPNNAFNGTMAGLVIGSAKSIFPSMNVAAGVQFVPMLQFKAKSVGVKTRMHTLVVSNDSGTFSQDPSGVNHLHWIKDDGDEVFEGVGHDRDETIGALFLVNTASKATFTFDDIALDITTNADETFYVLADFGKNMRSGDSVSLNISSESKISADFDGDNVIETAVGGDDEDYKALSIGSTFPLALDVTKDVVLVNPQLKVQSGFAIQSSTHTPAGLYCATDDDSDCLNGGGGHNKLVAGMSNVVMYVVTVDVTVDMDGVSFVFESPSGYFNQESEGISKLSLYREPDRSGTLDETDIFLGSTSTFNGNQATISNVVLPKGNNQQLLVLFDLGQRVADTIDELSFRILNITASSNTVAGVFPNPIVPYTYDVHAHRLEITSLKTIGISDSNVITQDTAFDVEAIVGGVVNSSSDDYVELEFDNEVPLSRPKFYIGGVDGPDRSYEFDVEFKPGPSNVDGAFDDTAANNSKTLFFSVIPKHATTQGDYLIDFDVYYKMRDTGPSEIYFDHPIRLTRSKGVGTNYKSAVDLANSPTQENLEPSLSSTNKVYSWSMPAYIESVTYQVNNKPVDFHNYASVQQNTPLVITFQNQGQDIDPASIQLTLNGEPIKSERQVSVDSSDVYYTYDANQGVLRLTSVGDSNGTVMLSANDLFGKPYPNAPFIFYTSDQLEVHQFLVYPNPYSPSATQSGVEFGFSLTRAADVSIQIYDATGRYLTSTSSTSYAMGYHTYSWDGRVFGGKMIGAGTYYVKLIAESDDQIKQVATTKLAVF